MATSALAAPGDHIRAGDTTIIPSIDVGFGHRTNAYRSEDQMVGGTSLELTPSLSIETEGSEVRFSLTGDYQLRKHFQRALHGLDRFNDFGVDAKLELLGAQVLGFGIENSTSLDSRVVDRPLRNTSLYAQFANDFGARVLIQAGPVLKFEAGGFWTYDDIYTPAGVADPNQAYNPFNYRHAFGPRLSGQWTFFPRTAVVFDGEYGWSRWGQNWVPTNNSASEFGDYIALPDSQQFKLQVGIRGRFTDKLVVKVTAGYGFSKYDEESVSEEGGDGGAAAVDLSGLDGLLVLGQITYDVSHAHRIAGGYRKDFSDSFFTNFMAFNELYLKYDGRMGTRVGVHGAFKTRFEDYDGEVTRKDVLLRAEFDLSYYMQDWAEISAGVWWLERASEPGFDNVEYDDLDIHLLAKFSY